MIDDLNDIIQPFDLSLLSPNSFRVIITRMPKSLFYIQSFNIPGITVTPSQQRWTGMSAIPYPGETMEFDDLSLNLIVDENLENYLELHHWIRESIGVSHPQLKQDFFTDIILFTLTNNKNPNIIMTFRQAFPYTLGGINFDVTQDNATALQTTVVFKFAHMILNPDEMISSREFSSSAALFHSVSANTAF